MTAADGRQASALLDLSDYRRVLRMVEQCGEACDFEAFREQVLEGFGRHFGYRQVAFMFARTFPEIFTDTRPVVSGRVRRMVPSYIERFHRTDPFRTACRSIPPRGPAPLCLDALPAMHRSDHRVYLERFLFRHRVHAKVVIPLQTLAGAAGIGLLEEESGSFGSRELATLSALAPHLNNLLALHLRLRPPQALAALTARQVEVARLAVLGAGNRQIAQALHLSVDTVKKHLSAAYRALGCTSRAELAAVWHGVQGHTRGSREVVAEDLGDKDNRDGRRCSDGHGLPA
ncbi:LuxR C-terminal-related transcriptional regulator [Streptomyces sp. NPDC017179]|uniref:helix-turn-helix transcriptional regulator n=1 Tax=Streptomyces sp. NPDC017179 TaxID=3364979 RepID=UPI0037A23A85